MYELDRRFNGMGVVDPITVNAALTAAPSIVGLVSGLISKLSGKKGLPATVVKKKMMQAALEAQQFEKQRENERANSELAYILGAIGVGAAVIGTIYLLRKK